MMWKFGKRNITYVVGFKMPEQVEEIGRPVLQMTRPLAIRIRKLAEKLLVPLWRVRADIQLAV